VLSEIHYLEQKEKVVESFYKLGRCSKEDAERLKITIDQLLSDKNIAPYFDENWKVKTEKEILMENGRTYIPDRLLFAKNTDEVVVLDYKTGVESTNHEVQITEYASALSDMGYKNTKRVLVYITDEIQVEVL
jgi:CRISPR/Cas system-associated exonuclease Cas4 (RecB family)